MKNTAVLGGTFNPVHKAHIQLIEAVLSLEFIDDVLLIPALIPPHKTCDMLASGQDRLNMCRLAAARFDNVTVSDIEMRRTGKSYTIDTITQLKTERPAEYYFVCGADMITTFDAWYRYEELLKLVRLIAVRRGGIDDEAFSDSVKGLRALGGEIICLDLKPDGISSTMVRNAIKTGSALDRYLTPEIEEYIKKNNLYGKCVLGG